MRKPTIAIAILALLSLNNDYTNAQEVRKKEEKELVLTLSPDMLKEHNYFKEKYEKGVLNTDPHNIFKVWKMHFERAKMLYIDEPEKLNIINRISDLTTPLSFQEGSDEQRHKILIYENIIKEAYNIFDNNELELLFNTPDTESIIKYKRILSNNNTKK